MKLIEEIIDRLEDEWKWEVEIVLEVGKGLKLWKVVVRLVDLSVII